jgi:serine/threonine protein kinase
VRGKSLSDYLGQGYTLNWSESLKICEQIADAVAYLHSKGICFQSLTGSNVILKPQFDLCLVDFGVDAIADEINTQSDDGPKLVLLAPEGIREGTLISSFSVDIWRLGLIMYSIVLRQVPFLERNSLTTMDRILKSDLRLPASLEPAFANILIQTLKTDPKARPSAEWVLQELRAIMKSMEAGKILPAKSYTDHTSGMDGSDPGLSGFTCTPGHITGVVTSRSGLRLGRGDDGTSRARLRPK